MKLRVKWSFCFCLLFLYIHITCAVVMVPFFLFDTDWMGREVYHGDPKGDANKVQAYDEGVREGAFGLLLNSVSTRVLHFYFLFQILNNH